MLLINCHNFHNFSLFLYKIYHLFFERFQHFLCILCKSFLSDYFFDTINLDKTGLSWLGFEAQGEGFAKVCFVFRICLCKYRNNEHYFGHPSVFMLCLSVNRVSPVELTSCQIWISSIMGEFLNLGK